MALQRLGAGAAVSPGRSPDLRYEKVDAGGVPAEWFRGVGCDEARVLLYLHGGGYSIGSIDVHRQPVSLMCLASGVRGLVIDYRLAPEHPFPAQLEDALAAYRWLLGTGVDASRIVVAGESAGGGLTLSTLVALRAAGDPLPACAVCISPWVDLEMRGASMASNARYDYVSLPVLRDFARRFVREDQLRDPRAAPIHADLRGLPPLLVLAGGAEVLLDDARAIAARAREAGVDVTLDVVKDMIHAWPLVATGFPQARATFERMAAFVKARVPEVTGRRRGGAAA